MKEKLGLVHDNANACLAKAESEDPALAAGVMLAITIDKQGLQDVWVEGLPSIPDGPLRCLSNSVYEQDWSGLTDKNMKLTTIVEYEGIDGAAP